MSDSTSSQVRSNDVASPEPSICVDLREQLFNEGTIGPVEHIQVSTERVVQLRGILLDLDPKLLRTCAFLPVVPEDPREFYATVVRPMLERHDVLSRAEVRVSGTGLHVILRLENPIVFESEADRDRWTGIIQVVQGALPTDPDAPHITAVTRAVNSVNGKNQAIVTIIAPGTPIAAKDVVALSDEIIARPFKTIMRLLTGLEKLEPCPICQRANSRLCALDHIAMCYGSCGQVSLERFYDLVFTPRASNGMEAEGHDATSN